MTASSPFDLKETKTYQLARLENLFGHLVPDMSVQLMTESYIDAELPRQAEEGDATRIVLNYASRKGKTMMYTFLAKGRFDAPAIDVDAFLAGYTESLDGSELPDDPIDQARFLIKAALNYAVTCVLEMDDEVTNGDRAMKVAKAFIDSAITALYDDPYDVVISIQETEDKKSGEWYPNINAMWVVKNRPVTVA